MKKEIFFDLSTVATGYAIYENGNYSCSGCLNRFSKDFPDGVERAYQMLCSINELVLLHSPDAIYGEQAVVVSHTGQDVTNYLHGGFRFLAITNKVDCFCNSTPNHWRKVLGFDQSKMEKGEASKRAKLQALERASEIAGKEITNDNEADAICLGTAHYIEQKERQLYAATI